MNSLWNASLKSLAVMLLAACNPASDADTKVHPEPVKTEAVGGEHDQGVIETIALAHHCLAGETVYLSAKMQKVNRNPESGFSYELQPTDKILSLCMTDESLTYRYGAIGDVGLERTATAEHPFAYFEQSIGRVYEQMFYFNNGDYYYYVVESGGMGRGVALKVFQGDRLIGDYFSGLEDADFYSSMGVINNALLFSQVPRTAHLN
ncbi:hypothetical protein ABMA57_18075 [Saccharospirillum sp. HFRX-1]|uniref:hypothetical protein n=1 Tax=unclassified Saccharospirillum TaxID=2633430 RepID=UPI003719BCE6